MGRLIQWSPSTTSRPSEREEITSPMALHSIIMPSSSDQSEELAPTAVLVVKNTCLAPGDILDICDELGEPLRSLEIHCCWCDFMRKKSHESQLFEELVEVLQANPRLESLKLQGLFPRNHRDVMEILRAMSEFKSLEYISLTVPEECRVPFGPEWESLAKSNPRLSSVCLEAFDLTSKISSKSTNTPGRPHGGESVDCMVRAFRNAVGLRHLFLGGCRICDKELWKLVRGLDYLKRIRYFHLQRCSCLSVISLLTVASIVNNSSELRLLDLTGNKGIFDLATTEDQKRRQDKQNKERTSAIQREGALTLFMRSLQDNSTLVELRLCHCGIRDDVFQFLLCALERNRKLAHLILDDNKITRRVGFEVHFLTALPELGEKLMEVQLLGLKSKRGIVCKRKWNEEQLEAILQALEKNKNLVSLGLDESKKHEAIDDILERNLNLKRVLKYEKLKRTTHDATAKFSSVEVESTTEETSGPFERA